jgi:sugar phosphate permease
MVSVVDTSPGSRLPNVTAQERRFAYRWMILASSLTVLVTSFALHLAWGNAGAAVAADLHISPAMMGAFVSAFFVGYGVASFFAGFAVDWLGPKRAICLALVPLGGFTAAFGLIQAPWQGLALQLLIGMSAGTGYAGTAKLLSSWFVSKERGRAFGILGTASSAAVLIANAVFPSVILHLTWRALYPLLGCVVALVLALSLIVLRNGPAVPRGAPERPERVLAIARTLLTSRNFVLMSATGLGGIWGAWGYSFWANPLMTKVFEIGPVAAGGVVAVFGFFGLCGKPLYGLLSDLVGGHRKILVVLSLVIFAIALLVFSQLHDVAGFRLIAPVLGFGAFAYSPLMTAMISERVDPAALGAAAGISNAIIQVGAILVPIVIGAVFERTHSFEYCVIAMAIGPLLGAACMACVSPARPQTFEAKTPFA